MSTDLARPLHGTFLRLTTFTSPHALPSLSADWAAAEATVREGGGLEVTELGAECWMRDKPGDPGWRLVVHNAW